MSGNDLSYISKKLEEEAQISRQTVKLLKSINKGCSTLTKELNYQLNLSLKAQSLYKRVLMRQNKTDTLDNVEPSVSTSRESLLEQIDHCKDIISRLKKSLQQSLPSNDRLNCLHKLRRFKQLLIFLKEVIEQNNGKFISSISAPKWPINQYKDRIMIRLIGCEKLNRSFSFDSIITGLPTVIKKSISDDLLSDDTNNINAAIKCDLIINNHIIFSTVTRPPSGHCWNQSFEFIHDFGNFVEIQVTWLSPYRSLDKLIRRINPNYRHLDFILAGFAYLSFDEQADRGFISRSVDLYPSGRVFLDTFIRPSSHSHRKKKTHRSKTSLRRSRSIVSPSDISSPTQASNGSMDFKFHMLALLGTGHFGKIILCQKIDTGQYFAIKALKKAIIIKNKEFPQVIEEKKVLQKITESNHPFLVHLVACLQDRKYIMFVLEFVEAGDLATHMHRMKSFSHSQTRFYAAIIVLCIEFLHDNDIMYRDLKLENLLVDSQGYLKLVDFGLSKTDSTEHTRTSTFCGTIDYMAPEMLIDNSYTRMVDWWALGVMVYYMITGQVPFGEETDMESLNAIIVKPIVLPSTIGASMSSFILSLMDRNPYSRLGSQGGPQQVKTHPYFNSTSFSQILSRKISAPFVPQLQHPLDLSYFDPQFTEKEPTMDSAESVPIKSFDDESFFDHFCL